jgi:hypothetical protein
MAHILNNSISKVRKYYKSKSLKELAREYVQNNYIIKRLEERQIELRSEIKELQKELKVF